MLRRADGRLSVWTVFLHFVAPLLAGVAFATWDLKLSAAASAALLTSSGLFAAFSFGLAIQLLATVASLDDGRQDRSPKLSRSAELTEMIAGSAAYLSIVAIATAAASLGVTVATADWVVRIVSGAAIVLTVHMGITAASLVCRVFSLTAARLRSLRSGGPGSRAA